eukprot:879248-Prymnesium_polylepis.1
MCRTRQRLAQFLDIIERRIHLDADTTEVVERINRTRRVAAHRSVHRTSVAWCKRDDQTCHLAESYSLRERQAACSRPAVGSHEPARTELHSAIIPRHQHARVVEAGGLDGRKNRRARCAAGLAVTAALRAAVGEPEGVGVVGCSWIALRLHERGGALSAAHRRGLRDKSRLLNGLFVA